MAENNWPCTACGEPVDEQTRFCPHCGQAQLPRTPKPDLSRTVLGVSPDAPAPPRPEHEALRSVPGHAPPAEGPTGTAMGVAAARPSGPVPATKSAKRAFAKTMMGQGLQASAAEVIAGIGAAASGAAQAADGESSAPVNKGRTMLGTPGPLVAGAVAAAAERRDKAAASGFQGRTMLGSPELQAAADAARSGTPAVESFSSAGRSVAPAYRQSDDPVLPPRRSGLPLVLGILVSLLLLGGAYVLWTTPKAVEGVTVTVETTDKGESMKFALLDAQEGTRIEFGDQVVEVKAGEAHFPLSVDSLEVGENVVVARVVDADGDSQALRVPLHVDYRLRVDTAPLHSADDPAIEVIAAATPGTKLTLDGEALPLDEQGRGMRRFTIDVVDNGRSGTIDHVVKYRVEPPKGEPVVGELHTMVPISTLQLDSPGSIAITDAESIEVAGAVPKGTAVTVDGVSVEVNDKGRFLHVYPLPTPGQYAPLVVAKSADRAPRAVKLEMTRVSDLTKAAATYAPQRKLTYAEIAQNPAIYKGQRVDFEGRVFNVKTESGQSVLQMLVRDCAKGRQCSLWVTYSATTRIASDSWVRVLGTVEGEQQFRSKRDEVVSVPKVQALFVLPK